MQGMLGEIAHLTRLKARRAVNRLGGGLRRSAWRIGRRYRRPTPIIAEATLLIGYIDAHLGLGQSLRDLAKALATTSEPFAIYPFGIGVEGRRGAPYMPERYDRSNAYAINVVELAANQLPALFAHLSPDRFDRSYNILRTYWELSRVPEEWRAALEPIDEIWAPNRFVAESFRAVFDRTITIIPPCVQRPDWTRSDPRRFLDPPERFHFLFSFDYHSYPQRKNPEGVLRAFLRAFPDPETPVGLVIKSTGAAAHYPEIKRELHGAMRQDPRIRIVDGNISRDEMLSLIEASNCYVSLHRSEGFGLGMAEAMMLGKPVIGTGYSGNADFVREATGFPVRYELRPLRNGEYVHWQGQVWAEPDEADAAAAMRRVFEDRVEAERRAEAGRDFVQEHYGAENVGRLAAARLAAIRSGAI
ncbi:hypothetical protein GCM10011390_49920 [Aureimonas endophytica]|uniref:Glycosyl transferase family 1 domain-containing protein n=1 Tax=Aureimonas endophytica TaxID=2027858 RepID=A0A917A363_9HYPH|nr:hypothetical protein GCM10011390_49920 [Aureimonas endophytica]